MRGHPLALAVDTRTARTFVANMLDGSVSVLDLRRGVVLRTVAVGHAPVAVAVDERGGRVLVIDEGNNSVSVLDARSGALLRTVAVALAPQAVAVDARSGHAFVVSAGGAIRVPNGWAGLWLHRLRAWLPVLSPPQFRLQTEPGRVSLLALLP